MSVGDEGGFRQQLVFFFPLALTQFMITASHTVINAGLARLPDPEVALAAYAVAKSVMQLAQNPAMMVRQLTVSLATSRHAYALVKRVVAILVLAMAFVLGFLGWTRAGVAVLSNVMGLSGPALDQAAWALRVFTVFPVASAARNLYQGTAILARNNKVVPVATAVRIVSLLAVLGGLLRFTHLPGAGIGAIAFTTTIAIEAVVLWWASRGALQGLPPRPPSGENLTLAMVGRFYWPLMVTALLGASTLPVVNAGIARGVDPEVELAAFAVAWALSFLLVSPANMVHQVSLAFTRDHDAGSYRGAAAFALGLGLFLASIQALMAFTPLAPLVLGGGVGASQSLLGSAVGCMRTLVLLPLVRVWREYCWGVLMRKRLTANIGKARAANLAFVVLLLLVGVRLGLRPVAMLGGVSVLFGEILEGLLLHRRLAQVLLTERRLSEAVAG